MNRIRLASPILPLAALLLAAAPSGAQEGVWTDLFNGKDLTGLKKKGGGTAVVVDGVIETAGGNGYLYTEKDFTHYRARVEWKNIGGGNAGYLHHIDQTKHACGTWPTGPELQMMQGDVGSIWTTDCKFNSSGTNDRFGATGTVTGFGQYGCGRSHFIRSENKEKPGDWNAWEIFVKGDSLEVKVNATVVMRIWKLSTAGGTALVKGAMGLQIEGSKVQWRNWQVMDLTATTGLAPLRSDRRATLAWNPGVDAVVRFNREGLPQGGRAFSADGKLALLPAP